MMHGQKNIKLNLTISGEKVETTPDRSFDLTVRSEIGRTVTFEVRCVIL